jgi:hypothetical protein
MSEAELFPKSCLSFFIFLVQLRQKVAVPVPQHWLHYIRPVLGLADDPSFHFKMTIQTSKQNGTGVPIQMLILPSFTQVEILGKIILLSFIVMPVTVS